MADTAPEVPSIARADFRSRDRNAEGSLNARDFVASLQKGFAILGAFSGDRKQLTLTEVAERAGLNKGVTRRLLLTLHTLGYVAQHDRYYFLTPRIMTLSLGYVASLELLQRAPTVLSELARELGQTCAVAVLDGRDIVFVARSMPRRRLLSVEVSVGTRLPAHATAMGQLMMSQEDTDCEPSEAWLRKRLETLPALTPRTITTHRELARRLRRVRSDGFAFVEDEMEMGVCSLAVPVTDGNERTMASLNIVMQRLSTNREAALSRSLPLLRQAAKRLGS